MGLDSYFRKSVAPGETAPIPKLPADLQIVGGIFSGTLNNGEFRGKVYHDIVRIASGDTYGLYEEEINSYDVGKIADILSNELKLSNSEIVKKYKDVSFFSTVTDKEFVKLFKDFVIYFCAFADEGYSLYGWW
jgi:hypothetical protein